MFEFYFQSGEFLGDQGGFWKDFLGIGIPLLIFYLTVVYDKVKEKTNKRAFEIDKLRYLNHLLDGIQRFAIDFHASCNILANTIQGNPNLVGGLTMSSFDDLIRIVDKINHEEHFHSYSKHIGDRNIEMIFTDTDTLNRVRDSIEQIWKARFERAQNLNNQILAILSTVREEINALRSNKDIDSKLMTPVFLIQHDFGNQVEQHTMDFNFMRIEFFERIGQFLATTNPMDHPYIHRLYHLSQQGAQLCAQLIAGNRAFADEIIELSEDIRTLSEDIKMRRPPLLQFLINNPVRTGA